MALSQRAAETLQVKESHHFHPILFCLRFKEPCYSVSRVALLSLDTVALIKSALDKEQYGWLQRSSAVEQLQLATLAEENAAVRLCARGRRKITGR